LPPALQGVQAATVQGCDAWGGIAGQLASSAAGILKQE
jgi:hypothetical protein